MKIGIMASLFGLAWALVIPFDEALDQLHRQNPEIAAQQALIQSAHSHLQASQSAWWPSAQVSASSFWNSALPQIDLSLPLPGGNQEIQKDVGGHWRTDMALELNYPLWTSGARLEQIHSQQSALRFYQLQRDAKLEKTDLDLALLRAQQELSRIQLQSLQSMDTLMHKQWDYHRSLNQKGLENPLSLYQLQSQMAHNRYLQKEAHSQWDSLQIELIQQLGNDSILSMSDTLALPALGFVPEQLVPFANSNLRAEELMIQQNSDWLSVQSKLNDAGHGPTLASVAGWHLGNPGVNMGTETWMNYFQVGLALQWKFWDGGETRHSSQALREQARSLQWMAKNAHALNEKQMRILQNQWQSLLDAKLDLSQSLASSDSTLILAQKSVQQGVAFQIQVDQIVNDRQQILQDLALVRGRQRLIYLRWLSLYGQKF